MKPKFEKFQRWLNGIEVEEVFLTESDKHPDCGVVSWLRSKTRFHVPYSMLDFVSVWVHEFTERSINEILPTELKQIEIELALFGYDTLSTIGHLLTSLCCVSVVDDLVQPEEFEREVYSKTHKVRQSNSI